MTDDVDPFLEYDAAYVMGALSPAERHAFEAHLADCPRCAQAVAELAGLPAMLDRVPLERVLQPGADHDPPPDLLLGSLIKAARAQRRRESMRLVAVGAVAAAVVAVAVAVGVGVSRDEPERPGATVAMSAVRPVPVTGTLHMTRADWGTSVSLVCRWVGPTAGTDADARKTYRLVAVPRDGSESQTLAQWSVLPGQDATVEGSTDLTIDRIARIELRAGNDIVLLRAGPGRIQTS